MHVQQKVKILEITMRAQVKLIVFMEHLASKKKVAHSVEEACELINKGFEYVGCINGAEIFRTRK